MSQFAKEHHFNHHFDSEQPWCPLNELNVIGTFNLFRDCSICELYWILYFCWCHHLLILVPLSYFVLLCLQVLVKKRGCVLRKVNLSVAHSCPPLQAGDVFSAASCCLSLWKEHGQVAGASDKGYRSTEWWSGNKSADLSRFSKQSFWIYFF